MKALSDKAQTKLAFPYGEGGLTRLLAAVKTEEVGTESFYNLFRLALLGTFPKGEGYTAFPKN